MVFSSASRDCIVIEFMGQPGSGKSTIIENLYTNTNLKKDVSFINEVLERNKGKLKKIIKFICILLSWPGIVLKSYITLYEVRYLFYHEDHHATGPKKFKRLKKMAKNILKLNWVLINKKKVAIHEGLAHHLQRSDPASIDIFLGSLTRLYGCRSIYLIYVNIDSSASVERMIRRNKEKKETKDLLIGNKDYYIELYKNRKFIQDVFFSAVKKLDPNGAIQISALSKLDGSVAIEENTKICESLILEVLRSELIVSNDLKVSKYSIMSDSSE